MNWHCTVHWRIDIDSHSRFCWQNQNHFDSEFSIVLNMRARARNVLLARARARERAKCELALSVHYI